MLDKHVVEVELLCFFFMNVARRLMATHADIVFAGPQENGLQSRPEWKLEGKCVFFVCFFFFCCFLFINTKDTTKLLTQWEGRRVCVYVCVFV